MARLGIVTLLATTYICFQKQHRMMFLIGILIQVKRFVDVKQEVIERE
jgi:hypothetical protein